MDASQVVLEILLRLCCHPLKQALLISVRVYLVAALHGLPLQFINNSQLTFDSVHHALRLFTAPSRILRSLNVNRLAEDVAAARSSSHVVLEDEHLTLISLSQYVKQLSLTQLILLAYVLDMFQQARATLPLLVDLATPL